MLGPRDGAGHRGAADGHARLRLSSYDTQGRGYITYQDFLQKLGVAYSADVHRPYAQDYFNFMGHFTKPRQMQEESKMLQQRAAKAEPEPAG